MTNDFYINSQYFVKIRSAEIVYNKETIKISPKYFDILLLLAKNKNEVVSRETLFKEIWGETIVVDESLTRAISELRKIFIGQNDSNIIETIPKKGYRFKGDISFEAPIIINPKKQFKYKAVFFVTIPAFVIVLVAFKFIKQKESYSIDPNVIPLTSYQGSELMPNLADNGNDLLLVINNSEKFANGLYLKVMNTEEIVPIVLGSNIFLPQFINNSTEIIYLLNNDTSTSFIISSRLGHVKRTLINIKDKVFSYRINKLYDLVYLTEKSIHFVRDTKNTEILKNETELIHSPFFDQSEKYIHFFLRTEHLEKLYTYNLELKELKVSNELAIKSLDYAGILNSKELLIIDRTQIYRYDIDDNQLERFYFLPHQFTNINFNQTTNVLTFNESQSNINIWSKPLDQKLDPELRIESTMLDQNPLCSNNSDDISFISTRCGNYNIWSSESEQALARPITTYKSGYISELSYDKLKENIYFILFSDDTYFLNKVHVVTGKIETLKSSETQLSSLNILDNDLLFLESNKKLKSIILLNLQKNSEHIVLENSNFSKIYKSQNSELFYAINSEQKNEIFSITLNTKKIESFFKSEKIIESISLNSIGLVVGFKEDLNQHLYVLNNQARLTDLFLAIPLESTYSINEKNIYYSQNDKQESDIFALQFKVN